MILEKKLNKQTLNINDTFVSIPFSRPFFKFQNLKIAKFSTREIGNTCRFAKFNTREKSMFKKIRESRNLIPLRLLPRTK